MKNIHILPTDKPSRLFVWFGVLLLTDKSTKDEGGIYQHIYITSDEEIKLDDYITDGYLVWKWKDDSSLLGRKKVILTTDQDLIKDGVQAIDDEFLKWFVKNPSCEEVEVISMTRCCGRCDGVNDLCFTDMRCNDHQEYGCEICYGKRSQYKIIIPKEETKQESCEYIKEVGCIKDICTCNTGPKQETLEEAAERFVNTTRLKNPKSLFCEGAKWQAEMVYNEAIEFLEFVWKEGYEKYTNSKKEEYWCKKSEVCSGKFLTTKEIFQEFLKQRQ